MRSGPPSQSDPEPRRTGARNRTECSRRGHRRFLVGHNNISICMLSEFETGARLRCRAFDSRFGTHAGPPGHLAADTQPAEVGWFVVYRSSQLFFHHRVLSKTKGRSCLSISQPPLCIHPQDLEKDTREGRVWQYCHVLQMSQHEAGFYCGSPGSRKYGSGSTVLPPGLAFLSPAEILAETKNRMFRLL